ncbi:hypothetical protein [Candidatus Cryosericum terrychapinii]|jgi:hypothetical protein|nr:hypothetical protein [Candidatus Cryosericum terrychapinii]
MDERARMKRVVSLRRGLLGMLTEVAFAGGLIGVAFLISWLFFVGR